MILPMKYGKRPWEPEEDNQLREMVEAGKTITMISLRLKRTSHRRPWSIGYPQGLTRQGWAAPKAGN